MTETNETSRNLWGIIQEELARQGIDVDLVACGKPEAQGRVICIAASLGDGMQDLAQAARDQVVMLRIDKESVDALDAWVQAGVAKSRSEAAALFLREGLKLRANELLDLKDALAKVEEAKRELRQRANVVLGGDLPTEG